VKVVKFSCRLEQAACIGDKQCEKVCPSGAIRVVRKKAEVDGVRIAVGEFSGALIVALPGPNEEVAKSLEVLVSGLGSSLDKRALAEAIAETLREMLREKMKHRREAYSP